MPVYDVPADKWRDFCDAFSEEHCGEAVSVEVINPRRAESTEIPVQTDASEEEVMARHGTLRSICCDAGEHADEPPIVAINVESLAGRPASHVVFDPSRLVLEQPAEGSGQMRIETKGDATWILHLSGRAMPGMLNGWV